MAECGGIEAYAARPLRARVTECHFGFYSSDEIRALSVLNITSTEVKKRFTFFVGLYLVLSQTHYFFKNYILIIIRKLN